MITGGDFYTVMTAVIPLYVAMILAYGSVRWWKIFSPDQCSGINRFVAIFAVPLLSFHFIAANDPYKMNFHFIAADTLQKVIMLFVLAVWANLSKNGSLEWMITIFSVSTLPNTLVMGIPLLIAMYGTHVDSGSLMVQIVVLQCIIWYTLLLFLFEYRGAKILIMEQFPETAASIVSFKVESDVMSLDGRDFLETDAELGGDGKLHVTVRKSNASRRSFGPGSFSGLTPRPSNLTGAEIYSLSSSRNPTPRGSNFNNSDFYSMMGVQGFPSRLSNFGAADMYSVQSSRGPTPRPSNFEENCTTGTQNMPSPRFGFYPSQTVPASYPAPNLEIANAITSRSNSKNTQPQQQQVQQSSQQVQSKDNNSNHDTKELHMFVWSSSASPVSETGGLHVFGGTDFGASEQQQSGRSDGAKEIKMIVADHPPNTENKGVLETEGFGGGDFSFVGKGEVDNEKEREGPDGLAKLGSSSTVELHSKGGRAPERGGGKQLPPASVMTRLILILVWRKLIRNPNTYSSLLGLTWSLISFRWDVRMPKIISESIAILSNAGLGMAMFSLGLFMALQPKIIACGNSVAAYAMAVRFLTGPAVMAAASIVVGLRGVLLRIAIVQAALPQGIVPFVFAKEYNVHPTILSTAVIFGMLIALPITLVYYILLGL